MKVTEMLTVDQAIAALQDLSSQGHGALPLISHHECSESVETPGPRKPFVVRDSCNEDYSKFGHPFEGLDNRNEPIPRHVVLRCGAYRIE